MGSKGLHILVVEDHAPTARNLAQLLSLDGHRVQVVADGPSALRAAERVEFDVALLDLQLPGAMDGYQVAQAFRQRAGARRPLLVVLTGLLEDEYRDRSRDEGIDLHLTKPAEPEALSAVLRRFETILRPPEVTEGDFGGAPPDANKPQM
jgi:CheY-like chemotaxis protein